MRARVLIRPKAGILDPQGEAVETALEHLGFSVSGARVGKVVDIEVEATDPAEAKAGTIRKLYAQSKERNAIHASDSAESAAREVGFFFPEAELAELFRTS